MPVLVARRQASFHGFEAGAEQRFAHVDVAEAGDDALVHQERLEVHLLAAGPPGEIGRVQVVAEGLDAKAAKEGVLLDLGSRNQRHVPEPAGVVVGDDGAARHREYEMVVLGVVPMVVGVFAELSRFSGAAPADAEPPRHAQMHGQYLAFVEMHQDVFRAAIEPGNPAAGETLGKSLGQRKAQIFAALLHADEAATPQHGL